MDSSDSDSGEDESEDDQKARDTKVKQYLLLNKMINLKDSVKEYQNRVRSFDKDN